MKITRAYKTELDPNESQRKLFYEYSGAVRFVYNWMLARRIRHYQMFGQYAEKGERHLTTGRLIKHLRARQGTHFPWLRNYASRVEETAGKMIDAAYDRFFKICRGELPKPKLKRPRKDGKPAGFPRFKSKRGRPISFKFWSIQPEHVGPDRIRFQRIGWVRLKERAYLPRPSGKLSVKCATVSVQAGRWFVSLQVEEEVEVDTFIGGIVGLDVGSRFLAVASDGRVWGNPRPLRSAQRRLKKLGRKLARQTKGSNGWAKTKAQIGRLHYRIANIRKRAIHQLTSDLLARHDNTAARPSVICIEDLNVKGMGSNHSLAMSMADASLAEIHRQIEYKAEWLGVLVIKADRFYPSTKRCPKCGHIQDVGRGDTEVICEQCGFAVDRDLRGALNLRDYAVDWLASKVGESINAGGDGSAGLADVRQGETAPMKPEAAMLAAMPV